MSFHHVMTCHHMIGFHYMMGFHPMLDFHHMMDIHNFIRGDPKKCNIRNLSSNLFHKSDFTFPHVFWNQNFEPVHLASLILLIQNQ